MFKKTLVCLDNSDWSIAATNAAIAIATAFSGSVSGCHVYAARLHDDRFRSMESSLPERYQNEDELGRQRQVHDSLITKGLQVISDSYLSAFLAATETAGLKAKGVSREGRNFTELLKEAFEAGSDLVVMGGYGLGVGENHRVGSVCERVSRSLNADCLIVKESRQAFKAGEVLAAAIDGSPESFAALAAAIELGRAFGCRVRAIAAYDHLYHVRAFRSLAGVLSEEAGRLFRFKEQERLHEEVIDKGLAKIYQDHLDTAVELGAKAGVEVTPVLLAGKPADEIIRYCASNRLALLSIGRRGLHSDGSMDIGATALTVLREALCNILLTAGASSPPPKQTARAAQWDDEAISLLERIPSFARGVVKKMVEERARREGITPVTAAFMRRVREDMGGGHDL